ncbi:hypothetical protein L3X38_003554 [Prunus dulcis]|uniref:Uncharacterized protein n=1 Tax=Prunus dulcis TaxID=3755 RepID=A0AAD4ZMA4_PRUDU|nr:hypothetical protein L3X38_003554 [Prunus dulcis]
MESSFPSSLDLNLALPIKTWVQGVAPENQRQFLLLQAENEKLAKMVVFYSKKMQKQLEVFENSGKRKRDHKRSSRESGMIIRGSSDEP